MKIPRIHRSEKVQQDIIEDIFERDLKRETNPERKKWLEWDYYCWRQNGKPVFGKPKQKSRFSGGGKEEVYTHNSKSDRTAYEDLVEEKKKRFNW